MRQQELIAGWLCLLVAVALSTFLILTSDAHASNWKLIELREASLSVRHFLPGAYDPLVNEIGVPNRELDKGIDLNLNSDFLKFFYFNNVVHTRTDRGTDGSGGQFRTVGWNYHLGARVSPWLSVEYEHHSQHIMDATRSRVPLEDSLGFKLFLFRDQRVGSAIFR